MSDRLHRPERAMSSRGWLKCAGCGKQIQLRNLRPAVLGRYYHKKCEPKP